MPTDDLKQYSTKRGPEKILSTPDPSSYSKSIEHKCDVLVIGGGIAGCLAAIGASEEGADVMLSEKYNIYSSGNGGTGEDHFIAIVGNEEWDNPEEFFRSYRDYAATESRERIRKYAYELPEMTRRLEKMGVPLSDKKTGNYFRIQTFGASHPYTIQYDGANFKRILARNVVDLKIPVFNQLMMTAIFVQKDRVVGVAGVNISDGSFHIFNVKAIVLTVADGNRLYRNTSGNPYDSWHSPYNTGDGYAMAFKAGAKLSDMEFLGETMCARGYSTPGTQAFVGNGCYLINAKGERFMFKYHPSGERAERSWLTWAIRSEELSGRGPCYIDARHLAKDELDRLLETLIVDKGPFADYMRQKGIDLSTQPMAVSVSEFHAQGRIMVNEECGTSVIGMYAAGDGTGTIGISRALVEGFRAGRNAAHLSRKVEYGNTASESIEEERVRVHAPLTNKGELSFLEVEQKIRDIMSDYVGFQRTESSMKEALNLLDEMAPVLGKMKADNYHELMRTLEACNIYTVARVVTVASLQRKETRWGGAMIAPRGDFPAPDMMWANKIVVLTKGVSEADVKAETRVVETTGGV